MQNKMLQDCVSSYIFSLYTELYRPCSVQWFEGWCVSIPVSSLSIDKNVV